MDTLDGGLTLKVVNKFNGHEAFTVTGYFPDTKVYVLKEEASLILGLPTSGFLLTYGGMFLIHIFSKLDINGKVKLC